MCVKENYAYSVIEIVDKFNEGTRFRSCGCLIGIWARFRSCLIGWGF